MIPTITTKQKWCTFLLSFMAVWSVFILSDTVLGNQDFFSFTNLFTFIIAYFVSKYTFSDIVYIVTGYYHD